jgi:MFS family permease
MSRVQKEPRLGPLIAIMLAAPYVGIIVLTAEPWRWNRQEWLIVGSAVAVAACIIAGVTRGQRFLTRPDRPVRRAAFFAVCSPFALAAFMLTVQHNPGFALAALAMTAAFAYGAVGTLLQWPGFRRPRAPGPHECPACTYDLTGNTSGVCPECGAAINDGGDDDDNV